jgi:hypothetical protein
VQRTTPLDSTREQRFPDFASERRSQWGTNCCDRRSAANDSRAHASPPSIDSPDEAARLSLACPAGEGGRTAIDR